MANNKISNLQKTLKKNSKGYNYKYTDLAGIHEALDQAGISYWQEIVSNNDNGKDYIKTHIVDDETGEEVRECLGCEIVELKEINGKTNPAQQYGSALTYCRRYSLLMAFGLATEDTDAGDLDQPTGQTPKQTGYKKLDFAEIRETLSVMDDIASVDDYAKQIVKDHPKITDKQKDAIKKMFDERRKELT